MQLCAVGALTEAQAWHPMLDLSLGTRDMHAGEWTRVVPAPPTLSYAHTHTHTQQQQQQQQQQ